MIIQTFLQRKYFSKSKEWIFDLFYKLKAKGFAPENLTKIFLRLRAEKEIWEFIENTKDQSIIDTYWKLVDTMNFFITDQDWDFVVRKLMDYNRFASAVYEISHNVDKIDTSLLVDVLQKFIKSEPEPNVRLDSYNVENIFDELDKRGVDDGTMITLEWMYMPILGTSYGDTKTPRLSKAMATDPAFFIQVLSLLYKPDVEDDKEDNEDGKELSLKQSMAEQAFSLLYHWKTVPGVNDDKTVDEDKLNDWVKTVREQAEKNHRLGIADDQIGKILAEYPEPNPQMKEGIEVSWPPEPICNIIEGIGNKQILSSFSAACYNKRGSSTRGAFDGGAREWHLTDYFNKLAAEKAAKYPKIASVFESLARGYAAEAKQEDERAERDRLDY